MARQTISENINENITIKAPRLPNTALFLLLPVSSIGAVALLAYLITDFHIAIAQIAMVIQWAMYIAGAGAFLLLAWACIKLSNACIDVWARYIDARNKNILLHTSDTAIVYRQGKEIVIHQIAAQAAPGRQVAAKPVQEAIETSAAPVLTFSELLQAGIVQAAIAQGKMLLGYVNGSLRYGSWLDLYSAGIGGVSGSGKSTTVRFLLFQAILAGARLVMIDPHIDEPTESLAAQFTAFKDVHALAPCGEDAREVTKRVRWLHKTFLHRKEAGIKGPALIFVLDEANAALRRLPDDIKKELSDLLLTISQEGRKFGIFAMIIAQRWSEQDLGGKPYGAAIRSSLASTLAHRFTDQEQAKKLIGGREGAKCLNLEQGHYYFRDTNGALNETITPPTYDTDGAFIQSLLDAENGAGSDENAVQEMGLIPAPFKRETTTGELAENADLHTLARRVVAMQVQGRNKVEIMREIWGVNPGASDAYKAANAEYTQVMTLISEMIGA
jgi:hypothetical protein